MLVRFISVKLAKFQLWRLSVWCARVRMEFLKCAHSRQQLRENNRLHRSFIRCRNVTTFHSICRRFSRVLQDFEVDFNMF